MNIAAGSKKVRLQISLKDCANSNTIPLQGKDLKLIFYKPNGLREEIQGDTITTKDIDNIPHLVWYDENYTFDIRGYWEYAVFADIESPDRDSIWVM